MLEFFKRLLRLLNSEEFARAMNEMPYDGESIAEWCFRLENFPQIED